VDGKRALRHRWQVTAAVGDAIRKSTRMIATLEEVAMEMAVFVMNRPTPVAAMVEF